MLDSYVDDGFGVGGRRRASSWFLHGVFSCSRHLLSKQFAIIADEAFTLAKYFVVQAKQERVVAEIFVTKRSGNGCVDGEGRGEANHG